MHPLPAAEVRRRGDRLRRRNVALSTVGGVAAVLTAIAVPVGIAQSGSADREVQPAPPTVEWLQEAPAGFPLDAGLTGEVRGDDGVRPLEQCAPDTWALAGAVDLVRVSLGDGVEGFAGRTLAVYPDPDAAGAALERVRSTVEGCEAAASDLRYTVGGEDLGGTEAETLVVTEQAELEPGTFSDLTFTRLSRDGNAVLLDQAYTSAGGAEVATEVSARLARDSALPRASLCVFDADPCDLDAVAADARAGELPGPLVPDDFPLLDGVPDAPQATVTGPSRDLEPIVLAECGSSVEVPEHTALVRADWSLRGEERRRQLVTFADAEQAQGYVDAVIALYEGCVETEDSDGRTQYVQAITELGGYDAAGGAHISWERAGVGTPGIETVAVVREGAAVLLSTLTSDEGVGRNGERIQQQTQAAFGSVDGVVAAMRGL